MTPAAAISVTSATASEIERRSMPGIEAIGSRTPSPGGDEERLHEMVGRQVGLADQVAERLGAAQAAQA